MVKILNYREIIIDDDLYLNIFSYGNMTYIRVSTYDVLHCTNNETAFTELRRVFEEAFDMKI